jgi:hypothetical protein
VNSGPEAILAALTGLAVLNVLLVAGVWIAARRAGLSLHRLPVA